MFLGYICCCARLIRTESFHLLLPKFDIPGLRPQLVHWSLRYQVVESPIFNLFPAGTGSNVEWHSLHCGWHRNVGWVQGCSQPLVASLSWVFFSFLWHRSLWGCEIYKQFCLPTWDCAASCFNNNDNNNININIKMRATGTIFVVGINFFSNFRQWKALP